MTRIPYRSCWQPAGHCRPAHSTDWWAGYDGKVAAERCQRCFDAGRSKRAIERGMTAQTYSGVFVQLNPATSYTHVLCNRLLNELDGIRCRLVEGHEGPCEGRG